MAGLSHIALNIALCANVSKAPPTTVEPVRVRMLDRVGDAEVDKTFKVTAGDGPAAYAEFDISQGMYRLVVEMPKLGCAGTRYVYVLPQRSRKIDVKLSEGPPAPQPPQLLLDGTAPISFLYTKPTYVLIDHSVACDQPVGKPTLAKIEDEYDSGAFYLWLYADPALVGTSPTLALRLRTTTGLAHYIRVPVPYAMVASGWPGNIQFNITEDAIDEFATDKTDVLLCPKLFETSVH